MNPTTSLRPATSDEFQACEKAIKYYVHNSIQVKSVRIDDHTDFAEITYISDSGNTCLHMLTRKEYSKYLVNPYNTGPYSSSGWTFTVPTPQPPTVTLPKGFSMFGMDYNDDLMSMGGWVSEPKENVKCECGSHKTYGTDVSPEQHSTWCKVYKKG